MIKLADIIQAKMNFWNFIKNTNLEKSYRLSKHYQADIYLKREDTQEVRSYKIRWAYNLISSLSKEEKDKWIVAASAWNHAQWVALTCNELKIKWNIYMPVTTPWQKVYKTKKFWWKYINVILTWDTFDDAYLAAREDEKKNWTIFVHPFNDERIIAWQATIWYEIIEKLKNKPDYIICPIWWWWLVSWMISAINQLSPKTKIIWVEPEWAPAMKESLIIWENISLEKIDTFVDWASVKKVWWKTFEICQKYKLKVITSPENRICSTILEFLREDWIVMEPAWALAIDSLKDLKNEIKWKSVVVIVSWWNFDFERLPEIKERSMKYEWLKRYLIVSFPQRPWALKEFLNVLWPDDDISRFEYLKKTNKEKAPALIWIETTNKKNFETIFKKLDSCNINYEDITDNDMYFDLLI